MTSSTENRTSETTAQYVTTYRRIILRIAKQDGFSNPSLVSPERLVRYLIDERPTWSKRTWIFYKRAVIVGMGFSRSVAGVELIRQIDTALACLAREHQTGAKKKGAASSSLKARSFNLGDQELLRTHLISRNRSGDPMAAPLFAYVWATLAVGLRPGEWANAKLLLENDKPIALQVLNAKATQGRGNGKTRTILLQELSKLQIEAIKATIHVATSESGKPGGYAEWQKRIRHYFRRRAKAALGERKRYPSLYTCRHQFSADSKSTLSAEEVAALMGHGSAATAGRSYARSRNANGKIGVRPVVAEVRTVRMPANTRHPSLREKSSQLKP